MSRLTKGHVQLDKKAPRENQGGLGMRIQPEPSHDYKRAMEARTRTTKPRILNLTDFDRQAPRDDMLMHTTDFLKNVLLENTREEREMEINNPIHSLM